MSDLATWSSAVEQARQALDEFLSVLQDIQGNADRETYPGQLYGALYQLQYVTGLSGFAAEVGGEDLLLAEVAYRDEPAEYDDGAAEY